MTQLTRTSPIKIFAVFVNRNMKLHVTVLNVTLDTIIHETVNMNNLMNKKNLEIIQLPTTKHSLQNFGIN